MKKRTEVFPLGMERKIKGTNYNDGSLRDMANLRLKDGNWIGVGKKKEFFNLGQYPEKFHIHDLGYGRIAIVYLYKQTVGEVSDQIKVKFVLNGVEEGSQLLINHVNDYSKLSFTNLNNVLIVNYDNKLGYFLFEDKSNTYRIVPTIPDALTVKKYYQHDEYIHETYLRDTTTEAKPNGYELLKSWSEKGAFWQTKDSNGEDIWKAPVAYGELKAQEFYRELIDDKKVIVGDFYIVCAFEMFNGSVMKPTNPVKTRMSYVEMRTFTEAKEDVSFFSLGSYSFIRPLRLVFNKEELQSLIDNFDGIINRINLYVSPALPFETINKPVAVPINEGNAQHTWGDESQWKVKDQKLNLDSVDNLHYLDSISIKELIKADVYYEYTAEIAGSDNINTSPVMPIDNFTHHTLSSNGQPMAYNGRVLLPNVTNQYYTGYKIFNFINEYRSHVLDLHYSIGLRVALKTDNNSYTVFSGWHVSNKWVDTHVYAKKDDLWTNVRSPRTWFDAKCVPITLAPQFVYPDTRATRVEILFKMNEGDYKDIVWSKTHDLTPHNFMNIAYKKSIGKDLPEGGAYLENLNNMDFIFFLPEDIVYPEGKAAATNQPYATKIDFEEVTEVRTTDKNRIQASDLNNPFIFPAKNSYRVGNGSVEALANTTQEMSEGQFGQYPIVAFCSEGIWALEIGEGEIFVSRVVPLVKDTTNNIESITVVRDGIFYSSDYGLKLLSGKDPIDISDVIEGSIEQENGLSNTITHAFTKKSILDALSLVEFKEFIKNCVIGYDRDNEEMIISNPEKAYSYVYMFDSKAWTKRSESFQRFLNAFPFTLAQGSGTTILYNTSEEEKPDGSFFMVSNPIEFESEVFCKIDELIARGKFTNTSILMLGSTDEVNYRLVSAVQIQESQRNARIPRTFYSCKSYVIVLVGSNTEQTYINRFELTYRQSFTNKLR